MQDNNKEEKQKSDYPGFNLLKLIIEDTAIDNTCHAKCEQHVIQNNSDARYEAFEHLTETIADTHNKHLYTQIISELVEYSLFIIDTDWDDYYSYCQHIEFLTEFLNKYFTTSPILINCKYYPFGSHLSVELQHLILSFKYEREKKYWKRYEYLMNHIYPIIDYLEMKKKWARGFKYQEARNNTCPS